MGATKDNKKGHKAPLSNPSTLTILKALRLSNGLSLDDMVKKGYNKYTISHIESGIKRAGLKTRVKLCDLFSVRQYFVFDRYGYAVKLTNKDIIGIAIVKKRRGEFI